MAQVGFEATIPVFERAKIGYALDSAATVVGKSKDIPVTGRGEP
jgi:hypothetical protein